MQQNKLHWQIYQSACAPSKYTKELNNTDENEEIYKKNTDENSDEYYVMKYTYQYYAIKFLYEFYKTTFYR